MASTLTLLGTGTPSPRLARAGSSYLLRIGRRTLMIDCGPGAPQRLLGSDCAATDIDALLLTHLHYDHCVSYAELVLTHWDQGAGSIRELNVIGPAGTRRMTTRLFGDSGAFGPDIHARLELPGSQAVYEARGGQLPRKRPSPRVTETSSGSAHRMGNVTIHTAEGVHAQPHLICLAYRIETPDGTIVFGGDTRPYDALVELAEGADLLLHMVHFANGPHVDERLKACCSGHLDAARTAREAGVKRLVMVHLPPSIDDPDSHAQILDGASDIFKGGISISEDGMEFDVKTTALKPGTRETRRT